jgi:hypothetical protein
MIFNEKATKAVEVYAEAIVNAVKVYNINAEVDIEYTQEYDKDHTMESRSAVIKTPIGMVVIFPDLRKDKARACVLKVGELNRMIQEGFSEEFIDANGEIYGDLMPFSTSNVEIFAYYLTHKIDACAKLKA